MSAAPTGSVDPGVHAHTAAPLVVVGGGEHARVVIDAARTRPDRLEVVGYADRAPVEETSALGVPWIGDDDAVLATLSEGDPRRFVIGVGVVGPSPVRERIAALYASHGAHFASVVHARATVAPTARVDAGAVVLAGAVVNPGAHVGAHAIVNTGAVIEHDVVLGAFAHVGPAAAIGGGARVEQGAYLGLGSRLRDHRSVGAGALVAMGAVVVGDIEAGAVVAGVPARPLVRSDERTGRDEGGDRG